MEPSYHILFAASEASPLVRTSYMGDVVSALPRALIDLGVNASLVIPRYASMTCSQPLDCIAESIPIPIGDHFKHAGLYRTTVDKLPVYLIDQPDYFNRKSPYRDENGEYADNSERFIFFARAIIELIPFYPFKPSLIHCHDWQTGLAPLYLKRYKTCHPEYADIKSLFTVHNLAYQGLFWRFDMHLTGLPWEYFKPEGIEFYGDINLLKAGLLYADAANTVSPRYCREIQTSEFGCGLEGVLRSMKDKLSGILNGADYTQWTPQRNPTVATRYSMDDLSGKLRCKEMLIAETGLNPDNRGPLIAMISPLYSRKGLDLLEQCLPQLVSQQIRFVLQGIGDRHYVKTFTDFAKSNPGFFSFIHNLDQDVSRRIIAGSDILLKPSRYEPCGLNQLYAMHFGTIPVVRRIGGLDDSVYDHDPEHPGLQTGFKFDDYSVDSLKHAINRALNAYKTPDVWQTLMKQAMSRDFSWERSAGQYLELYQTILKEA